MSEDKQKMEKIISLCKRRGFVFPSSEIYGGFSAIYDFGPYGVELKNNIKKSWWRYMVQEREDIVGLDSAIFTHPKIWEASGHVQNFADPLIECKKCHNRFRVDHLLENIGVVADEKMSEDEIGEIFNDNREKIKCPACGKNDFTEIKKFNLLVKTNLGNLEGSITDENISYLRGETCQGIYVNFKNVLDSTRVKIPFGIAQIGKAFRNEITARQFIFRTREFEQMEMQYFVHPKNDLDEYERLKQNRWEYYLSIGIKEENLKWHKHEKLAFYAKDAYDIEYNFPTGFREIEGLHARGNYDLSQHSKFSGQRLEYRDAITGEKYIPHVIEASAGADRVFLAIISEAYTEEKINDEDIRVVLKFKKDLAPIKVAVFPLVKNKTDLTMKAREVFNKLKVNFTAEFDDNGNIGKRYRRQDEIGTPYCVTIDYDTLKDNTVTVRDRDSMKQVRVKIDELCELIKLR